VRLPARPARPMSERRLAMKAPVSLIRILFVAALLLPLPSGEGWAEVRSTIVPAPREAAAPAQELPLPPGEGRGEGKAIRPRQSSPDLATATIVDLSHAFDDKTIYWPTSPSSFKLEKL